MDPETAGAAPEAPAPFSLESAYAEASKAGGEEPTGSAPAQTDAPSGDAPDTKAPASAEPDQPSDAHSGEEPGKSNRQAGKDAYERGRREAIAEFQAEQTRLNAEAQAGAQREQFNQLLTEANLPDDGNYETAQRRAAAQQKLGQLYASNTVTQTAYQRGQADYERSFWSGFEGRLGTEIGLDETGVRALMSEARSGIDFAKRLVEHGKAQEKATWEPEIAKRDTTIEELRGKLAGKSPSPEAGSGVRTNGAATFDGSWESAYALARAAAS